MTKITDNCYYFTHASPITVTLHMGKYGMYDDYRKFEILLEDYRNEVDDEVLEDIADMMESMAQDDPEVALTMSRMFREGDMFPHDDVLADIYRRMADIGPEWV